MSQERRIEQLEEIVSMLAEQIEALDLRVREGNELIAELLRKVRGAREQRGETLGEAIERQGGRSYPRGGYPPPHETDGPHYDWPKASG